MKRKLTFLSFFVLLLALVLSLSGCGLSQKNQRAADLCRQMTDAVLAEDMDAAYELVQAYYEKEDFEAGFSYLCEAFEGVGEYELHQTGFKMGMDNGASYYVAAYLVDSDIDKNIAVEVAFYENEDGLFRYTVSYNAAEDETVGSTDMKGDGIFKWILLVVTALSIAFVVLMVLDCIRRQLNSKALWIIVIAIGHVKLLAGNTTGAFYVNAKLGALLPYSRLLLLGGGLFDLAIVLPIGAVVYFFLRRKLTESYQEPTKLEEMPEVTVELVQAKASANDEQEKQQNNKDVASSEQIPKFDNESNFDIEK